MCSVGHTSRVLRGEQGGREGEKGRERTEKWTLPSLVGTSLSAQPMLEAIASIPSPQGLKLSRDVSSHLGKDWVSGDTAWLVRRLGTTRLCHILCSWLDSDEESLVFCAL